MVWRLARAPGSGRGSNRYLVLDRNIRTDTRLGEAHRSDFRDGLPLRTMLGGVAAGS
jgi:hypothetical protein